MDKTVAIVAAIALALPGWAAAREVVRGEVAVQAPAAKKPEQEAAQRAEAAQARQAGTAESAGKDSGKPKPKAKNVKSPSKKDDP